MRKFIAMLLFAMNIQILSTNTVKISEERAVDYYMTRFQIHQEYTKIVDKANKVLGVNSPNRNLPLSLPIDIENFNRISGRFGIREKHPILGYTTLHKGIDISAPYGANVYSTADGVVSRRGYHLFGYGRFVEINHGNNIYTIYAHLSSTNVFVGDPVRIGDTIGKIGSTGLSTGPHLHYEIRKGNYNIDPVSIIGNDCSDEEFITKLLITNYVQMNPKIVTKNLTLAELKLLKDAYTNEITSLEYDIKNGKIQKVPTLKKTVDTLQVKHENLIRIKDLLAKANSIESSNSEGQVFSNNADIYKLSLLRDFKNTMSKASENPKFNVFASDLIASLNSEIAEIDSRIRNFNTTTKIEIELLEEQ